MRNWLRVALVFAATHACASSAAPAACSAYAQDLHDMVAVDQALRSRWDFGGFTPGAEPPRIVQMTLLVDRHNTARLKRWIGLCGWPQRTRHGAAAANDAWLLAQHADQEPAFQKAVLVLLQRAVARGEADASHLAFLSDRVALAEGRPQLYGTQLDVKGECELAFRALDDRSKVEARRKAIGWPSLDEYLALVRANALPEKCRVS